MEDIKKIQEFFSKPLKENTTNWPKEVPSRYGDIIFRLVKVMPDRAKYELIDAETGKTWEPGGRVYNTVNQLKSSAEDTIKPQGGRQSSQFESVNEQEEDKIDIITMDVPLFIRILEYSREDAQTDMDLHDLAEKAIAATKQQGILSMDDYDMLIGELDQLNEQSDYDKETLSHKQGLKEKAAYIAETIKLGLTLNEELCEKRKRYIKARQAAGEKSSAYLSGRAVRVCKGQIEWPKKGKKKK